jgi:hypothetical protein
MSTKIYEGVRFPRIRLADFVQIVRERGLERAYERAWELVDHVDMESSVMRTRIACDTSKPSLEHAIDLIIEKIGDAADAAMRQPLFDLESAWRLWVPKKGKFILAMPHGEGVNHVEMPKWVESYGYWDNTDQEEGVSDKAWRQRERDWQIACLPHEKNHQMLIEVFHVEKRTKLRGLDLCWLEVKLRDKIRMRGKKK